VYISGSKYGEWIEREPNSVQMVQVRDMRDTTNPRLAAAVSDLVESHLIKIRTRGGHTGT
jgi:hypothetical protein